MAYPFRTNTNEGTRWIDAAGKRIHVYTAQWDDTLRADPGVQAVLQPPPPRRSFAPAQAADSASLEGCSVRMVYRTPLRECRACVEVGELRVDYDFDAKRQFVAQQVAQAAAP